MRGKRPFDYVERPATEAQKRVLRENNIQFREGLTVDQAHWMIRNIPKVKKGGKG